MTVWRRLLSKNEEFSNPCINSDKKNGSCSKDDLTTTESFGNEKLEYLRKCFKLCCEDITTRVEVPEQISAEQRCFRDFKNFSADQRCFRMG